MALKTSLVSYWKLDEASGTRFDSHGSNDLTDNNTVGSATGKIGNAADFERDNSEYLSHADNASLSTGDIDWTFACWVKFEQTTDRQAIAGKWQGSDLEWELELRADFNGKILFEIASATGFIGLTSCGSALSAPSSGTWYFVVCWSDSVANTINIQINNGTIDSVSFLTGGWDSSSAFEIGNGAGGSLDGLVDEPWFSKRVYTSDELTEIYNAGAGLGYDSWDAPTGNRRRRVLLAG